MSKIVKFEMTGNENIDELLEKINNGDDVNIRDNYFGTVLILASCWGYIDICKLLVENGADVNIQNKREDTALMRASNSGYIEICKLLLDNSSDVNIQNYDGYTALMYASSNRQVDICKLLLENGADINLKDEFGNKPIDIMKKKDIYTKVEPYKILGLRYFKEVFKEHAEAYIDIFETTLYSQDLELDDIKANIDMFYSTIISKMDNNAINESLEL